MTKSSPSHPRLADDQYTVVLKQAKALLVQANQRAPSIDTWEAVFPSDSPEFTTLTAQCRHRYSRSELERLRHQRRAPLPICRSCIKRESYADVSYSDPLPSFPFTSTTSPSQPLTVDVLLSASESSLRFADLNLSPNIISALSALDLTRPSPVQLRTLPRTRLGSDVIAHAKSGTGKTLAYALAVIDSYLSSIALKQTSSSSAPACTTKTTALFSPQALILTPTRELATQVHEQFLSICSRIPKPSLNAALLVGGVDERLNVQTLAQTQPVFIVGTPGRVLALINNASLQVHAINMFVLDEADRLLSRHFVGEVRSICMSLPSSRQTLAFSATFEPDLRRTLLQIMNNPAYITCDVPEVKKTSNENDAKNNSIHENIAHGQQQHQHQQTQSCRQQQEQQQNENVVETQKAVLLGVRQTKLDLNDFESTSSKANPGKIQVLREILKTYAHTLCIVFVNSRRDVSSFESHLKSFSVSCRAIFAGMKQSTRDNVMEVVRKGDVKVLVATDLLARGVDFPSCDLVIQVGLPIDVATYLHRVGRAGRFGGQGRAITLYGLYDDQISMGTLEEQLGFSLQKVELANLHRRNSSTPADVDTNATQQDIPDEPMPQSTHKQIRDDPIESHHEDSNELAAAKDRGLKDAGHLSKLKTDLLHRHDRTEFSPSTPKGNHLKEGTQPSDPVHVDEQDRVESPYTARGDDLKETQSSNPNAVHLVQQDSNEPLVASEGNNLKDSQPPISTPDPVSIAERSNDSPVGQTDYPISSTQNTAAATAIITSTPPQHKKSHRGNHSPNVVQAKQGTKRRSEGNATIRAVVKKQRTESRVGDNVEDYQLDKWEAIARAAEKQGYDEGYSRARRIAYELCRKLVE